MKNHIISIILLLLAAVAFVFRFLLKEKWQIYCDIIAFVLPTVAALVEIYLSEKRGKETEVEMKRIKENVPTIHVEGETLVIDKGI